MSAPNKYNLPRLLSLIAFIAVLLPLLATQYVAALASFDRYASTPDHRLSNLRQYERQCRWPVIDSFLDAQPLSRADAIVFGDSQVYTRGATQEQLFYTHWLGPDATVINISWFSGILLDMDKIAQRLVKRGVKVKHSYVNVNPTHFSSQYAPQNMDTSKPPQDNTFLPPYPSNLRTLVSNRHTCAFRSRNAYIGEQYRKATYRKLRGDFRLVKLRSDYMDFDGAFFDYMVPWVFGNYNKLADNPVVVGAPMAYDQFPHYNFSGRSLTEFAAHFKKLCQSLPEANTCLDLSISMTSDKHFEDIIHLSAAGQKQLGEILRALLPKTE